MNNLAISLALVELLSLGVMIGYMAGERQNPNEPKPKKWEDRLHKEWMKGFQAGEKATLKRVTERLKREEINRVLWNEGEDDG